MKTKIEKQNEELNMKVQFLTAKNMILTEAINNSKKIEDDYIEAFKHCRKMQENIELYKSEKIKIIVPQAVELIKVMLDYVRSEKKDKKQDPASKPEPIIKP